MFQPNSTITMEEDINVDETKLNPMKELMYLGSIIASDGHIEAELQKRVSKASMSFGRLRERLWNNHNVSIRVKGKINRAIILSTLLCRAKTGTVYRRHMKKLQAFMMRHVLYSQLPDGQRPRGRPRIRYKDTFKRNLKKRDTDTNS